MAIGRPATYMGLPVVHIERDLYRDQVHILCGKNDEYISHTVRAQEFNDMISTRELLEFQRRAQFEMLNNQQQAYNNAIGMIDQQSVSPLSGLLDYARQVEQESRRIGTTKVDAPQEYSLSKHSPRDCLQRKVDQWLSGVRLPGRD